MNNVKQVTGEIICVERLKNSTNGNPRYSVSIELEDGSSIKGKTASDHSFAYNLPKEGRVVATFRTTRAGSVVFTDISKA